VLGWVFSEMCDNFVNESDFPIYGNLPVGAGSVDSVSRKFILFLDYFSALNSMFGWTVLKSFCMRLVSLWLDS
jgi:hypothetical protein